MGEMALQNKILDQLDAVLTKYRELKARSQHEDCSDQPGIAVTTLNMLMSDAISRFAPPNSQYIESMKSLLRQSTVDGAWLVPHMAGILSALRTAYDEGYLATVVELVHADIFSDFVEMAEYLLSEGYKDPAAVIIGSVLEEHLRQLCAKNSIPVDVAGKAKKADQLNADLAGKAAYSKLDQKSITTWLDLRNKAAHGKYGEYSKEQVALHLQGIRDFMSRIPA
jgi:hypothetical protein